MNKKIKLSGYIKPYAVAAILAPLTMMVEVVMDLLQPALMADIINIGILDEKMDVILWTSLKMLIFAVIGMVGGMSCTYFSSKVSQNFGADLRSDLFKKVQTFSFAETDKFSTGSLVTRLTNDVTQLQNLLMMALRILIRTPLMCIGGIVMALSMNIKFGLILVVSMPIMLTIMILITKFGSPLFSKMQKFVDKLNAVTQENLTGVRVVKAYVREENEIEKFSSVNDDLTKTTLKVMRMMALLSPLMMLFMNGSVVAVIYIGGLQVEAKAIQVGQVTSVVTYMTQILMSMMMISMLFMMLSRAKASYDRVKEVMATEPSVKDKEDCVSSFLPAKGSSVVFENVSFKYPLAMGDPVLRDINIDIKPGQTVAILGSTGSGKSSLVNLIPRFYDVSSGRILVDGIDVKDYKSGTLREKIGMVLQKAVLFSGSIAENIRWGNPSASDDEVYAAAKTAQADDFVKAFPDGYDTELGQGGLTLSGGQKQRLCIARALLKKPQILIMDDSTSALDMGTEARLKKALKTDMKDMTVILIAQRISSVMAADKIIVMDGGKISAEGTHEELMQSSDIYKDIYSSQIGQGGAFDD